VRREVDLDVSALSGWPDDVAGELDEVVKTIVRDARVAEFYVGRGVDLDQRASEHQADDIAALYETESPDHAMIVEEYLIGRFINHKKNSNTVVDARGGVSDEFVNYVYIAVWWN